MSSDDSQTEIDNLKIAIDNQKRYHESIYTTAYKEISYLKYQLSITIEDSVKKQYEKSKLEEDIRQLKKEAESASSQLIEENNALKQDLSFTKNMYMKKNLEWREMREELNAIKRERDARLFAIYDVDCYMIGVGIITVCICTCIIHITGSTQLNDVMQLYVAN